MSNASYLSSYYFFNFLYPSKSSLSNFPYLISFAICALNLYSLLLVNTDFGGTILSKAGKSKV